MEYASAADKLKSFINSIWDQMKQTMLWTEISTLVKELHFNRDT